MPKVSVYLSQELYDRAKEQELPISALAQEAIENALRRDDVNRWVERMRNKPPSGIAEFDMSKLMDEVRGEFGT
jgi:post-segregation antitoxin (ccd killing protein)